MKFSIVTIAYNEAENIVNLAESAKSYMQAGGQMYLYDTGSTDDTVKVAEKLGFIVVKSKINLHDTLTANIYKKWKKKFGIIRTPFEKFPINFFCFDTARNDAANIAKTDIVFFMDGCDTFINFNFNDINTQIEDGYENFHVIQKYGDSEGGINRFYNRKKGVWIGHVHEYVQCNNMKQTNCSLETVYIHHKIIQKDRTAKYLAGLIMTHMKAPTGRWNYYVARDFYSSGHYADARTLFLNCYNNVGHFLEERAAAMCWIAKCYLKEGKDDKATKKTVHECYKLAYNLDSSLREPCFETAQYYLDNQMWPDLLKSATKCVDIITKRPAVFFEEARFDVIPHLYYYLYMAYFWTGSKDMANYYWKKYVIYFKVDVNKHSHWPHFKPYAQLSAPCAIAEIVLENNFTDKSIKTKGNYKYLSTIDDTQTNMTITEKDQTFMTFMRKYTSPCVDSIDIFAGKGLHAIDVSKIIYPNTVHAIEKDRLLFQQLNANSFINGRENIKAYEISKYQAENIGQISDSIYDKYNIKTIRINNDDPSLIILEIIGCSLPFIAIYTKPSDGLDTNVRDKLFRLKYKEISLKHSLFYIPERLQVSKRVAIVCTLNSIPEDIEDLTYFMGESCLVDVWNDSKQLNFENFDNFMELTNYYDVVVYYMCLNTVNVKKKNIVNYVWYPTINSESMYPNNFTVNVDKIDALICYQNLHADIILANCVNKDAVSSKVQIMSHDEVFSLIQKC